MVKVELQVDPVCEKPIIWVIQGFDTLTCSFVTPRAFATEAEAKVYCEHFSSETCLYGYRAILIGKMLIQSEYKKPPWEEEA